MSTRRPQLSDHPAPLRAVLILLAFTVAVSACTWAQASRQLRQLGAVNLPGEPGFDTVAMAKGMLVMTHTAASTVDVLDPTKRRVIAEVTGIQSPRGIAVNNNAGKVYVADAANNSVAVINTDTWTVAQRIALPDTPGALLLDDSGKRLYWISPLAGTLSVLDLTTRENVGTVNLGASPRDMALDPDREAVLVTLQDTHQVVAVDPKLQIVSRFNLNASQPTGIAYDPRTRHAYVAVRYAVLSLNADNGTETNRVPAVAGVDDLWLDPETRTLYAAGPGSVLMLHADGGRLGQIDEIETDVRGHNVAYDSEKKIVFVPGGREGKSRLVLLRPMNGEALGPEQNAEAKLH